MFKKHLFQRDTLKSTRVRFILRFGTAGVERAAVQDKYILFFYEILVF
jgi:hypothetical protein